MIVSGIIVPSPHGTQQDKSTSLKPINTYQGLARLTLHTTSKSGLAKIGTRVPASLQVPGYIAPSFAERFYNRIAVIPSTFNLGSISSDQRLDVQVWNAYLVSKILLSITVENGDGIHLTGESPPVNFNRLAVRRWIIDVSTDGPPEINCIITFNFAGLPPVSLTITGSRSAVWLFSPDWSDDVIESLEWKTAVLSSQSGAEQRRALRLTPRRTFEYRIVAAGIERQRLENVLYTGASKTWLLPIWSDATYLDYELLSGSNVILVSTLGRDFQVNSLLVISYNGVSEAVEVKEITLDSLVLVRPTQNSFSKGTVIYPARSAILTDTPSLKRHNDAVISTQIRFQITEHNSASDKHTLPIYRGHPVLEGCPNWADELSSNFERTWLELDNDTGIINRTDPIGRPFVNQVHTWLLQGRTEQADLRRVFSFLRGRQRCIWVSSDTSDFYITTNILGNTIDVIACGFSDSNSAIKGRQDIRILLSDGRILYRRITAASLLTNNRERLSFEGEPIDAKEQEVIKISLMSLCRQDSDTVTWTHKTDADGIATVSQAFKGVRDELE